MARKDDNQSLGDALRDYLKAQGLQGGIDQVNASETWNRVLGPGVAGYTEHVRLSGGTLYVSLRSSVLREELSLGTTRIIALINEELGREVVERLVLK